MTRIQVTDNVNNPLNTITDLRKIEKVVSFVNQHRNGWEKPWAGIPVPTVIANFYDGESPVGHFGAGSNFFETQRAGDFASMPATVEERKNFLHLLELGQ